MKRYIIERDVPGVADRVLEQRRDVAAQSNRALTALKGKAQWEHSYVVDDKTFCVYIAEDEAAILEHAKLSGFPASKITEVRTVIDPVSENS
jgi:GTP1/Obg family GTP-binding protein